MTESFSANTAAITGQKKIALVQACWHRDIVDEFCNAFTTHFHKIDGRDIDRFELPGAFEIPLRVQQLAATGEYAGIVATALVVDGGVYRHEFVATAVIDGLMRAQMDTGVPVFSGVLTPHDFLSEGRHEFFKHHFVIKGEEVANACAQTLGGYQQQAVA